MGCDKHVVDIDQIMAHQLLTQEIKQKILSYQIKTIQECSDSLFTDYSCSHERYLGWQLAQELKELLKNYDCTYRWIGNDPYCYIYAYFYVLVIGCANQPHFIMKLKAVLYDLARKYLAQFQQKLLIQFLCLIEYSQDRYLFFRKYSKVEPIMLKIFKEIESRSSINKPHPFRQTIDHHTFSKMTTKVTSPSRINQTHGDNSIKSLRNSDYYNSSMKRIQNQYKNAVAEGHKQSSAPNKMYFIEWYRIYNQFFTFLKMTVESDKNARLSIDIQDEHPSTEEFMISVERGCFFVIEMVRIKESTRQQAGKGHRQRNYSKLEESQMYLKQLIHKQFVNSKILGKGLHFSKKSKADSLSSTPKFITNKQSNKIESTHFYKRSIDEAKSVQVEVLEISQFQESHSNKKSQDSSEENHAKPIIYKKKINNLDSIGQTTKTLHQNKHQIVQEIRSHPLFAEFLHKLKNDPSQEEKAAEELLSQGPHRQQKQSQKGQGQVSKCSIEDRIEKTNKLPILLQRGNRRTVEPSQIENQKTPEHVLVNITNPELKDFHPTKITQIPANEKMLSAKMLRKSYRNGPSQRQNVMERRKNVQCERPFFSNSPPAHIQAGQAQYCFSPKSSPLCNMGRPVSRYFPKAIKFTYL